MSLKDIENLLHHAIGLNAASIGSSSVMTVVQERMTVCGLADVDSYHRLLRADKMELKELIEEIVIPETWFFRDDIPFQVLVEFVTREWLPNHTNDKLRVLSLPCATGEEPYSIAMALVDAELDPARIHIDALDISHRNVNRAKQARYRNNAFRSNNTGFRDRYFEKRQGAYHLHPKIQAMVNFDQASILDGAFINQCQPYDVVFCRNLLIYFDRATQQKAIEALAKLLSPKGILFAGHAEIQPYLESWFVSHCYPKAFAVRKFNDDKRVGEKTKEAPEVGKPARRNRRVTDHAERRHDPEPPPALPFADFTHAPAKEKGPEPSANKLDEAYRLADAGHLSEAAQICLDWLDTDKKEWRAYFLLGVVRQAVGNIVEAIDYLGKVVYLNPNHLESLMLLATLEEQQGHTDKANRLRERARRVQQRKGAVEAQA